MEELLAIMMSWAVTLSGYPAPAHMPTVELVPHAVLVAQACGNQECKVLGWFPPGETIYLDDRLDLQNDLYADSILVHEMVHYLQHQKVAASFHQTCVTNIGAEREAYQAQREYLLRYGVFQPVGYGMSDSHC